MGISEGVIDMTEELKGDVRVIKLKGRLDAVSSPLAEKRIFDLISAGEKKMLLEFSGVVYISSAGMRMLLSTTKKLKTLAGKLIICSINPNVMDVFKMSGFDHVLELTSTEDEALRKF